MEFTAQRKDALIELFNIGYGRAAAALSELTGQHITLRVPDITLHNLNRLTPALEEVLDGEVTCVHQMFAARFAETQFYFLIKPPRWPLQNC